MILPLFAFGDAGIFVLRLAIGLIFLIHGMKKLNGKMGGFMTFIGVAEIIGGVAILVGFLTQMAALGIAIIMLGALYKKIVAWRIPFTAMNQTGWEFDFILLAGCITLMTLGSGAYGIDVLSY